VSNGIKRFPHGELESIRVETVFSRRSPEVTKENLKKNLTHGSRCRGRH
jgi:mitochondrial fission protein ELM1